MHHFFLVTISWIELFFRSLLHRCWWSHSIPRRHPTSSQLIYDNLMYRRHGKQDRKWQNVFEHPLCCWIRSSSPHIFVAKRTKVKVLRWEGKIMYVCRCLISWKGLFCNHKFWRRRRSTRRFSWFFSDSAFPKAQRMIQTRGIRLKNLRKRR